MRVGACALHVDSRYDVAEKSNYGFLRYFVCMQRINGGFFGIVYAGDSRLFSIAARACPVDVFGG